MYLKSEWETIEAHCSSFNEIPYLGSF